MLHLTWHLCILSISLSWQGSRPSDPAGRPPISDDELAGHIPRPLVPGLLVLGCSNHTSCKMLARECQSWWKSSLLPVVCTGQMLSRRHGMCTTELRRVWRNVVLLLSRTWRNRKGQGSKGEGEMQMLRCYELRNTRFTGSWRHVLSILNNYFLKRFYVSTLASSDRIALVR